jgi:hypothetical protein
MSIETPSLDGMQLRIEKTIDVDAPPAVAFQSILDELAAIPDGKGEAMKFKLEAWPGGRWFRDTGNDTGHLWGHVSVIKPPRVLELTGPLMIPSATINHVSYRVTPRGEDASTITMVHTGVGAFDEKMAANMEQGWGNIADAIKRRADGAKR